MGRKEGGDLSLFLRFCGSGVLFAAVAASVFPSLQSPPTVCACGGADSTFLFVAAGTEVPAASSASLRDLSCCCFCVSVHDESVCAAELQAGQRSR